MPNFSGAWSLSQQFQAKGQNLWPSPPGAPTIGTATAGTNNCASITFTAPTCTGYPPTISSYTVTSTPGCITANGVSSPLVVSGLANGSSYTFKVKATNTSGTGSCSAASNSITAVSLGSQSYTTAGTYSWVAPAGVTSVSTVAVGGGGNGARWDLGCGSYNPGGGGGGGSLSYKNNITVVPGNSYTVTVGSGGGGQSSFTTVAVAPGGGNAVNLFKGAGGVRGAGDGGGNGGCGSNTLSGAQGGGGGAGGYAGTGGNGSGQGTGSACAFPGNGGGGGGGYVTAGGGVGLLGQGANGAAGNAYIGGYGGGGSGGDNATSSGGGLYGGGGGGRNSSGSCSNYFGARGAVRIVWPGTTRTFPSTNVGNP